MVTWLSKNSLDFPDPEKALDDPNGLLAAGGDLDPKRLMQAYHYGIFPWYSDGQPILWWSPDPRLVLYLDEIKISKSLVKSIRNKKFKVTFNQAFDKVIRACALPRKTQKETWILPEMIDAYLELHKLGHAQSIEVWEEDKLVGGLYGVVVGEIFCGESMFSFSSDTSKIALAYLVEKLKQENFHLIDCQLTNPHLESLGARLISRKEYLSILKKYGK